METAKRLGWFEEMKKKDAKEIARGLKQDNVPLDNNQEGLRI